MTTLRRTENPSSDQPDLIIGIDGLPHGVVGLQQGRIGDGGLVPEVLVSVEFPPEHVTPEEADHLGGNEQLASRPQSAADRAGVATGISHPGREDGFLSNLFPGLKHIGQFIKKMHNFRDLQNSNTIWSRDDGGGAGGCGLFYSNIIWLL